MLILETIAFLIVPAALVAVGFEFSKESPERKKAMMKVVRNAFKKKQKKQK